MSDFFARMIDRAAGRVPTVRAAIAPSVLPTASNEPSVEPIVQGPRGVPASAIAAPSTVTVRASEPRLRAPVAVIAPSQPRGEPAPIGSPSGMRIESIVTSRESPPALASPREIASSDIAPRTNVEPPPVLAPSPAPVATPAIDLPLVEVISTAPIVSPPQAHAIRTQPIEEHAFGRSLADITHDIPEVGTPRDVDVAVEPPPARPPRPLAVSAPRIDLREALATVGRALSQPPRQPAQIAAADEVHVSIGHIEVRAAAPPPVAPAPARRDGSITLAEFLRRRPGSAR